MVELELDFEKRIDKYLTDNENKYLFSKGETLKISKKLFSFSGSAGATPVMAVAKLLPILATLAGQCSRSAQYREASTWHRIALPEWDIPGTYA